MEAKTMIVTGASRGIGAGVTRACLERGYNVVANSLHIAQSGLVAETAVGKFGSIDGVVNNAGIFFTKPFTEYTTSDFERVSATHLQGYIYVTQLAVKQMLAQQSGGSVTEAITRSLAMEYVKQGIRFNAVAPGVVNTPMHGRDSHTFLKTLTPMGELSEVSDIVDAIVYLTEARHVTGEVLHVDGGVHNGKW